MSCRRLGSKYKKEQSKSVINKNDAEPVRNIQEDTVSLTFLGRICRALFGKRAEKKNPIKNIENAANRVTADKSANAAGRDVIIHNHPGINAFQAILLILCFVGLVFLIGYLMIQTKVIENFHGTRE